MNDSPEKRDEAIARIMRTHGGHETDAACPDAERLAAFADGGLPTHEAAQLERHFAACDRCREILALQTQASAEAMPVAAPSIPVTLARPAAPPRRLLTKRWLVPAVAAAAAVILWLALRPTPPVTQTVAQVQSGTPAPAESGTTSPAGASPTIGKQNAQAPEIAEATPPPAPSYSGGRQVGNQVRAGTLDELKKAPGSAGSAAPALAPQSANEIASDKAKALLAPGADAPVLGVQSQAARDEFTAAARSFEAPPNAQANNGNGVSGIGVGAGGGLGRVSAPATLVAPAAVQPTVFAAPDRSIFWRVGARGLLERSNDQGRTWQPQSSGVAAELLSGAAVSGQVAWVVGRGSVILRTTDGMNWQRITAPAGPAADWTSVEAGDALNVTIVSSDMRSFITTDGGRSWTRQ